MEKSDFLKLKIEQNIEKFLRPIIREQAKLKLESCPPQHGFTKRGKSTIGVTVKLYSNYSKPNIDINLHDWGYAKRAIICELSEKDWISYYKSEKSYKELIEETYSDIQETISRKKNLPQVSKKEIEEKVRLFYNLPLNENSNEEIKTKYYVLDFQFETKEDAEKFIKFASKFNGDRNFKDLLGEIYKAFKNNLDLTYIRPEFDYWQIREIVKGLLSEVDVSIYASTKFKSEQMVQIRLGLEAGVNVNVYARPEFKYNKMEKLKDILLGRKNPKTSFDWR